jgi:hypothetical protein
MSEEVTVAGKTYISSKRASKLTGYSQDYIGYLARTGQVSAQRIGGLWYVVLDSLKAHQEVGKQKAENDPTPEIQTSSDPESFVGLDGKSYISASRASKSSGYNQDYVGQLARSGQIVARQVGNRWYVDETSLRKHKEEKDALLAAVQTDSVGIARHTVPSATPTRPEDSAAGIMEYFADESDLLPVPKGNQGLDTDGTAKTDEAPQKNNAVTPDMSNVRADNRISINRGTHTVSSHPLVLHRPNAAHTIRRGGMGIRAGTGAPYVKLASAALTIVIVVSLGFAGIRSQAVYSLFMPNAGSGPGARAAVASVIEPVAMMLENLLTRELRYTRND